MRHNLLKLSILCFFLAGYAFIGQTGSSVHAYRFGPDPSLTGAPGEGTCTACHGGGPIGGVLSITGLPASYTPGQEISITVKMTQASRLRYGFQLTAIDDAGKKAGDLIIGGDGRTQTQTGSVGGNDRQYINHTNAGSSPSTTGEGAWIFTWKAPSPSAGKVTFYISGNAANGTGTSSGDTIYNTSASIEPAAALTPVTTVSAASFANPAPLAAEAIGAAFGTGLAQGVVIATTLPLPTELGGTQVKVRDAAGNDRDAGLFFVSGEQINYLIPKDTGPGAATVTVKRSGNDVAQGTLQIESVAPGLFSANASGQGVAAAVILRRQGTVDTFEPVAQLNAMTNRFEPRPINLGPETDQVFLILFGTGFRGRSAISAVTVTIGGTDVPVFFAGASPDFVGLDQANIGPIPRSLATRGNLDVVFKADTKQANTVILNFQ